MFRHSLTLALLIAATSLPARAEHPMPAGYERMLYPDAEYNVMTLQNDWTAGYSAVAFNTCGTPGARVTDLEIEWYRFDATTDAGVVHHSLHIIEVPNDGDLKSGNWLVALGQTDFFYIDENNARPIDLEIYYRKDPFSGVVVPTYAYVAVENVGKDFSPWQWIPPTPYNQFMSELAQKYGQGWRPYDTEFARDENGDLVGTALLAPIYTANNDGSNFYVPTKWEWFLPDDFADYEADGWQLLDVETPIAGLDNSPSGDGLHWYYDLGYRFGIFVDTSFITIKDTEVTLATNAAKLDYGPRLIDIEQDAYIPPTCIDSWGKELCQAGTGGYLHTAAWLNRK